jgi:flagellar hook-associated protein 3 FlgL
MELRVNLNTMINQVLASTSQQTARLAQLQAEATTGNQINEPSDNPAQAVAIMAAEGQNAQLSNYLTNIQSATSSLNASVSALQQAGTILSQAKQLALQGSQSITSQQEMDTMANQVDQLLNQLLSVANTKNGNQYLFSGTSPQTQPFAVATVDSQGRPATIAYQGGSAPSEVIVGPQQTVQTNYAGNQVFQGANDAFKALIDLRDALRNTAGLTSSQQNAAISNSVNELQNADDSVLSSVGAQSASLQYLQGQQNSFQDMQLAARKLTTTLQGADLPTLLVQLQEQQNQLQLTLAATAQVLQQGNLLNFLK